MIKEGKRERVKEKSLKWGKDDPTKMFSKQNNIDRKIQKLEM